MKLEKIKLNGFKSFADPVEIHFTSPMTGVVGPNGCGKSNIVDAVRWVMGESSRHIRATSLEEVIFSGTRMRSSIGQASIELIFDNSDGVGGKFAQYSELSVKRTAARDGESKYFINSTRCRRRDVADVFFGTGLGVRSYAVIGQGMISGIVDAKPDEMRVYVEEAAGVSQYKQRRRDTENRIRRTRDNLDRVQDIVDEVDQQLTKLKRQVKNAERFKLLRKDKEKLESELLLLRCRQLEAERETGDSKLQDLRLDLEKVRAGLFEVEAQVEEQRALVAARSEEINRMKEAHYQLGAKISSEEKDIETHQKSIERVLEEQVQVKELIERDGQSIEDRRAALIEQEQRCQNMVKETERLGGEVARLAQESDAAKQALHETAQKYQEQANRLSDEILTLREETHVLTERLGEERHKRGEIQSQLASLEALQQAALRSDEGAFAQWLDTAGLKREKRLLERIRVADGWERAAETVLGAFIAGFEVSSLEGYVDQLKDFDRGTLVLFEAGDDSAVVDGTLADKVSGGKGVGALLNRVQLADDTHQALRRRASLEPHQSIITRDGIWVGPNWMRLRLPDEGGEGVLLRERRMDVLREKMSQLDAVIGDLQNDLEKRRTGLLEKESTRDGLQAQIATLLKGATALEDGAKESGVQALEGLRKQLQVARDALHRVEMEYESATGDCRGAREQIEQLRLHLVEFERRRETLDKTLGELRTPVLEGGEKLKGLLARHSEEEAALRKNEEQFAALQAQVKTLDGRRAELNSKVEERRESYEQASTALQVIAARCKDARGEFDQLGLTPEDIEAEIEEGVDVASQTEKLTKVQASIERLGGINLVALEEFDELTERKQYLDTQIDDLTRALDTLEDAVRKIEIKTRSLFKKTFEDINANLQDVFPRLFGSGSAWLELTENDFLTAGVAVMVRLPGKRQVSIHLLSGGEKALTAIAVLFSVFELNPAPFCLLDEVDAPLDEHNVEQFCQLLKRMSERVQFILITHNKTSMEYMDNLIGITMQEPGVSRLVSVDVESAAKLANA